MSSFQSAIDEAMRAAEEMGADMSAPDSAAIGGLDIDSLIAEAESVAAEVPTEARVAEFDQPDLQAGAAREMEGIVDWIPYSPWELIPAREIARGAVGMYMDAANTLANPGMRAQFFRSVLRPVEWVAGLYDSITGAETDPTAREMTSRLLAERLSMALEPEGSGLTTADLPSEIVAMRGMAEGLAAGQEEGIRGDIARGVGQSLPQFAALAATGGGGAPVALAAQTLIPLSAYSQGMQEAIADLEQERADAALAGEPLPPLDLQDLRTRAEASAVINTVVEMGGAALGGRAIGKIAKRMSDTPAGRGLSAALARTGAARAAERMAVTPATAAFRAVTKGTNRITPGFLRGLRDIALTSGAEEAGEELVTGALMAPFTYAPLSEDLSNALYSSMIGFGAGAAGGVGVTAGVKAKQVGANLYDSFRPESDADRIARVAHSETLKKRIDFTAELEESERQTISLALESMNGMTPDERGRFLRELNDQRGNIESDVEGLLEQRRNKEEALAGIEQQEQSGATPPEGSSFATMRDLVMEDIGSIDQQIAQATRDKVVAEAKYNAVAEKMLDMPKDARQSTPENVLRHVGQSSKVELEETQAPKNGARLQSDLEALGMKVVWFKPKQGTFNPGFHTKSTRGMIYLNANADTKAARAYALEEMFHDIQMFRPDIAAAYMQSAGMESVYRAGVEYAARGRPESAQAARLDEAAIGQAIAVAERVAGAEGAIAPTEARRGAARLEQEGAANLFAPTAAALSKAGTVGSFLRTAARLGLSGRQARAAVAVLDTVARAAAVERVQGVQQAPTMSPLARTLLWANDLNISYARGAEGVESVPASKPKVPARVPTSDIGHKREKATGRYVGAPDWVGGNPRQLAVLRRKLRQLAMEGEAGRYWYENSSRAILAITGGDIVEAEKIVALIALYSPNATVPANTSMALTAYFQWKAGMPIDAGFSVADKKAEMLLRENKPWSGIKTNSFYQNLMVEIDPSKLDEGVATMDMWMALAFDYGDKALDQGPKYKFSEREIQRLADELGWKAHQVQAAIWTAMKGRIDPIRAALKEREIAEGIGSVTTKTDPETGKVTEFYAVNKGREYDHFRLAHKMGMEYALSREDIEASKYDFSNALNDRMVQMSWEATPSTKSGRSLPGIHSAPIDQKFEYLQAVKSALTENGRDIIADIAGLPQGTTVDGFSAWLGDIGAGAQSFYAVSLGGAGKSRVIKPASKAVLDLASNIRGYVMEQDAVVYHTPVWDDAKIRHNGIQLTTTRPLSQQEMKDLYAALHAKFQTWDLAPGYRPDGARILNFTALSNKDFHKGVQEIIESLPDDFGGGTIAAKTFRSEGDYIGNDWEGSPNGEDYLGRIQSERPDLLQRVRDLRARVEAVNRDFSARYGWGTTAAFAAAGQPDEVVSFARAEEDPEVAALKQQIADLQRQIRDVQNVTAAQRVNALREVRILQRKLSAAELIASQKIGQAQRAAARAERMATETEEVRAAADKTIAELTSELDTAQATIRRMRAEARRAASNAEVAALEAKIDRVSNWAYAIGRNEGLMSGQIQGQRQIRRTEVRPLQIRVARMTDRIALLETRLNSTRNELMAMRQRIRLDARMAQRAIDFAYDYGLRTGRVQGMMKGRLEMQRRMQRREDTLQRRLFDLRELMNTRVEDVTRMRNIVQRMARDAAETLPVRLRGPLAARIASVRTVAQANRIAVEAMKLAANEEVNQGLATIARVRRQMGRHGMRANVRDQIEAMLTQADTALRQANRRRIRATVTTMRDAAGRSMGPAIVNAVAISAEVANAADLVQQAAMAYAADRAAWVAERDARVQRYADLSERLVQNMQGRRILLQEVRADRPPRIGLLQPIKRANSDIYTLMVEIEGISDGVINEMLEAAQAGKGEAALEHAALMRQLQPALAAAGYGGLDEYALRNGLMGDASTVTMQVTLGGEVRTLPVGVVMSMAAMDPETLALFGDGQPNNQGIKFRGAETTLTIYPTQQEILAARAALTPGQRGMIDAMKQILEFQIRDRAMEAIWLVEGDQPPIVPNYWPRIRDNSRFGGEQANVLNQAGALVRGALTSVGFANARTGGREPFVYSDAFQTWDRHVQVALDMIHMAQPYRDAATVLSDRNVMETMDRQNGAGTAEAVMAIFSNGVGATARSAPTVIDALTSNVTGAVLAMSPRTWAKIVIGGQIRLSSEIPLGYWTSGVARATAAIRNPANWRARVNEIHALNGYFSRRHNMQFRTIISGALSDQDRVRVLTALEGAANSMRVAGQSVVSGQMMEAVKSFRDAANGGNLALSSLIDALRYMDEQIMLVAVEARLAEVTDEGLLTGQDAMREAALRAERDFRRTQNASDEFDDSSFAATQRVRGNTAWRLLFPFSSDPLKARNQLRRAFVSGEGRLRAVGAVGGNMAASTAIGTMSVATTAYMVSLVTALFGGDDDPEEDLKKQAMEDAKRIPTNVASEVLSSTMGYTGIVLAQVLQARQYGRAPMVPVVARPVEQAIREAGQVPEDPVRVIPALLALSQLAGFPAYQMYRFIEGFGGAEEKTPKQPKTPQQEAIERIQRRVKALQSAGQQSR